jgi:hypothetical protein
MDYSVNTRPLLQQSESESDFEDDVLEVNRCGDRQDDHVVVTKDLKPFFKTREPIDRYIQICFVRHSVLALYSEVGLILLFLITYNTCAAVY